MPDESNQRGAMRLRHRRETVFGEMYDPVMDTQDLPKPPEKTPEQLEYLVTTAKKTSFLVGIDDVRLRAALSHMRLKDVKAGEIVFKQGDPGDSFYIVEEGTYTVLEKEDGEASEMGHEVGKHDKERPIICELAALFREPRPHTLKAETDGKLWELDRALYTRVVVKLAWKKRQRNIKFMNACPLLNDVEPYEKTRLCDAFITKHAKAGDVIIKEGDEADGMYWIVQGQVEVKEKDAEGEPIVLKEKNYFGELGLLLKNPRNATCTAKTDCEFAFLETEAFERLMGKLHNIMLRNPERYGSVLKNALGKDDKDSEFIR